MKKIAFLAGTSGLIGMQLLHQLIKDSGYDVIISVGRRKLALKHEKLVQIVGDMAELMDWDLEEKLRAEDIGGLMFPLWEAIRNQSLQIHAFCTLGTTIKNAGSQSKFREVDHDFAIGFAVFCKKFGASKFLIVSAMGADPQSKIFYNQVKGETEEDLKIIPFEYLGIFRPSLLMGQRSEFRFGEEVAKIFMKPMVWFKLAKNIRPIYDHQVAKAMIHYANQEKSVKVEVITSGEMQNY